jgi:hypothetical protein
MAQVITNQMTEINEYDPRYAECVDTAINYRILRASRQVEKVMHDPRYWRVVEFGENMVQMLRVPVQMNNDVFLECEESLSVRLANREELAAAFRTTPDHQYKYPWGDTADASRAPYLMRNNPNGMGMNMAGLYFNGPENMDDPDKDGLWMVTAERDAIGYYIQGDRSGTGSNVGVFTDAVAGQPGLLPGTRGLLPGTRDRLKQDEEENFLTPAGIGEGMELSPNEGYLLVKEMTDDEKETYTTIKKILNNKVTKDYGISLVGIGEIDPDHKLIAFGVAGHCMLCPNPYSLTLPLNGPAIAAATQIPVIEYPEFKQHKVSNRVPIVLENHGIGYNTPGQNRIYYPA